jgi:nitroreductase
MDVLEAILTRRSIRQFQDRPVPEDLIEKLLRAAMSAPGARNSQPWQFVVITNRHILRQASAINPYAKKLPASRKDPGGCTHEEA